MTPTIFKFAMIVLLAWIPAALAITPASQPATMPVGQFIGYPDGPGDVHTAGFHKLIYQWIEDGQTKRIPFSIFLPHGYGTDDRRWPMLIFLAGLGDRGVDPGIAMAVGAPLELGRSTELSQWMPMIVLTPQCPSDKVWDTPGMAQIVHRLIDAVASHFSVDTTRFYVSGFSDGGKGSWVLAAEAPGLFAVAAPIVSREFQPEETARQLAGSGTTVLVISGMKDPKSEPASSHMVEAMRRQGVDVVYAPVPDGQHFIWRAYYSQREFYEWLLLHRRGQTPPKDRATGEHFAAIYASHQQLSFRQQIFEYKMQRNLDRFEPYWFVDNCGEGAAVGLKPRLLDRTNVLVTVPLSADMPCRLQTTRQLPKDSWTELAVEVGHPPKGEWELVVRVNEQEQLRTLVNDQTAPQGWLAVKLPLRSFAGGEARLQLIENSTGHDRPDGYWASVKLIEGRPH